MTEQEQLDQQAQFDQTAEDGKQLDAMLGAIETVIDENTE